MKRIISLLLSVLMLLSMVGCGKNIDPELASALVDVAGEVISAALEEAQDETPAPQATLPPQKTPAPQKAEPAATPEPAPAPTDAPAKSTPAPTPEPVPEEPEAELLAEDGTYTHKDDVALYIHQYGRLPGNFITKKDAEKLGWSGGSLEKYAPGKCIGGSRFGNYEKQLPEKKGRTYTECDIDTLGAKSRGAKRIVFSNDGLIYYTDDHYETFTLLYGEE